MSGSFNRIGHGKRQMLDRPREPIWEDEALFSEIMSHAESVAAQHGVSNLICKDRHCAFAIIPTPCLSRLGEQHRNETIICLF